MQVKGQSLSRVRAALQHKLQQVAPVDTNTASELIHQNLLVQATKDKACKLRLAFAPRSLTELAIRDVKGKDQRKRRRG